MKKRIVSLFLIICTLVLMLPIHASTEDSKPPECIRGIDYGRIRECYNSATMEVRLKFWRYQIPGRLEAGNGVERNEANKTIKEVMKDLEIDSYFLEAAHNVINRAAARYAISAEEIAIILADKFGNMYQAYQSILGNWQPKPSDLIGMIVGVAAGIGTDIAAIEGAPAYIIGALTALGYTELANAYEAYKEDELSDITNAVICAVKLAQFYDECNERISKLKSKGVTRMVFDGSYTYYDNQRFMGVSGVGIGFKAEGVLEGDFKIDVQSYVQQTYNDAIKVFDGSYTGNLSVTVDYHLEKFDEDFKDKVFLGCDKLPFRKCFNNPTYKTIIDSYEPTKLVKRIYCDKLTLKVSTRKDRFSKVTTSTIPMDGFSEENLYRLKHEVFCVPDGAILELNPDGTYSYSGAGITQRQAVSYRFNFSGDLIDGRYATLNGDRQENVNNIYVACPMFKQDINLDETYEDSVPLITDNDAFGFLSSGTLVVNLQKFEKH